MGLAGAFLAQHVKLIEPTQTFDPSKMTFLVWVMLIAGGSGNNRGAILGAFLVWFIWSSSELVTNGLIELFSRMFDSIDIGILKNRAGFLRMLLIGLLLQFILQKYPKGILPEMRPAISGKLN
jgi:branched-chain amino acid transport system permease protein